MTEEEIIHAVKKVVGLGGMTVNERLYVTGVMDAFDKAKDNDKNTARKISELLQVDEKSILAILA